MKGCQTFEELQELGAEKIHERTHISREKIELVLTKSYGEVNKIQFMGFLSILEREYGVDLNEIRQEYLQYEEAHRSSLPPKQSVILQPASNTKQKWMIAGIALIIVLVAAGYFVQANMASVPTEDVMQLSSSAVEVADEANDSNTVQASDVNVTAEMNTTAEANNTKSLKDQNSTVVQKTGQLTVTDGLEIRPLSKVWVGLIDMENHQKSQTVTKEPIKIDTSKNWLIVLGHGRLEIASASENKVMKENGTVWFVYENGILKRLTKEEFKERNGGTSW